MLYLVKPVEERPPQTDGRKRKTLAKGLTETRIRLRELRKQVKEQEALFEKNARALELLAKSLARSIYPNVPEPSIKPTLFGDGLPSTCGIYFLWDHGIVKYVGQSTTLSGRVRLSSHHRLKETDLISYVEIPKDELVWAECYYIGILRPTRNGGTPSNHG